MSKIKTYYYFVVEFDDEKGWHRVTHDKSTKCSHCQEEFTTKWKFDEHHAEKHPGQPWICQICNKEIQDKKTYYRHLYTSHGKPFACNKCYYKTDQTSKMKDHVRLNHEMYNGYSIIKLKEKIKCHHCNENEIAFENEIQYFEHYAQAHPDQLYICCENSYSYKDYYKNHRRKFHSKNFVCDACKYTTPLQETIEQHVRENHPENEKNTYVQGFHKVRGIGGVKCGYCNEIFNSEYKAKLHHRSEHNGLPNKCSICEKTFEKRKSLMNHIYTTHKRPFACNICDYRAYKTVNILKHVDKHRREGDSIKGKKSNFF